jgi:hypothetical protein
MGWGLWRLRLRMMGISFEEVELGSRDGYEETTVLMDWLGTDFVCDFSEALVAMEGKTIYIAGFGIEQSSCKAYLSIEG